MSNSSFSVIDEVVKNSDFTIFCDIKDCGNDAKSSAFTENKLRELFDRSKNWLKHTMNFYQYTLKQKYYLVVKNNDSRYYYTYLFDSVNIENSFYNIFENDGILNHDRYSAFYEELQEYYNTYRTDLLRFKCPLSHDNNGIYIIVYIKKSMYKLNLYFKDRCINVDYAIKYSLTFGENSQIYNVYIDNVEAYQILNNILSKVSSEEIIDFIKETNLTDEEKEKYYLELVYVMASGNRFRENYMRLSDFSDKIFIKELCTKYNLVFSENCFVETMKKLAKMIE